MVGGSIVGSAMSINQPIKGNNRDVISIEFVFLWEFHDFGMGRLHRIL